jgi:hypothetical protein
MGDPMGDRKTIVILCTLVMTVSIFSTVPMQDVMNQSSTVEVPTPTVDEPQETFRNLREIDGHFTENRGQIGNDGIVFSASSGDISIGFLESRVMLIINDQQDGDACRPTTITIDFIGSKQVLPVGIERRNNLNHFFLGGDERRWESNVPTFDKVLYADIYDGIDLVYYFTEEGLKYDWVIRPDGDPDKIAQVYQGIDSIRIDTNDQLVVATEAGTIREDVPSAYQVIDGLRVPVDVGYELRGNRMSYGLGSYDPSFALTIDPLITSTYIGGDSNDEGIAIDVDHQGFPVIAGYTRSWNFPTTTGVYDDVYGSDWDFYVAKLNLHGTNVLWSTFVGGTKSDGPNNLVVDPDGNIYVAGRVGSDFPTTGGSYDSTYNGGNVDGAVFKLSSDGSELLYSTFIGGSESDECLSIDLATDGSAYIVGDTHSDDFPTTSGSFDTSYNGGGSDAYACRLSADGSDLEFSTFLGGSGSEGQIWDIALDSNNVVYIAGSTSSSDFPTTSGCLDDTHNGEGDLVVVKLKSDGSDLIYSTFIGGSGNEWGGDVCVDGSRNIYVAAESSSSNFPVNIGGYDTTHNGDSDAVVFKLNTQGTNLLYSTFVGGSNGEYNRNLAIDRGDQAIILGYTDSGNFPTTRFCYDNTLDGGRDVYVSVLSSDGSKLVNSTFFGGSSADLGFGLALGSSGLYGHAIVNSNDWPTSEGCYDPTANGGSDGGVFQLEIAEVLYPYGLPHWGTIPTLHATEDVPLVYDFSLNVSDPDTPIGDLYISSQSDYVTTISGLNVTFVFPDGIHSASVPLTLSDGSSDVPILVEFVIEPVNDPPEHDIPLDHIVNKSEATTIDLSPHVWDIDDAITNLTITEDSPYATFDGLNLTVEFPEVGEDEYNLTIHISDGKDETEVVLHFSFPTVAMPSAPQNLQATEGDGYVLLSWEPPEVPGDEDLTGYHVLRGTTSLVDLLQPLGNVLTYNDTDVTNGVTYYYSVCGITISGEGDRTVPLMATPSEPPLGIDDFADLSYTDPAGDDYTFYFEGDWDDEDRVTYRRGITGEYPDLDIVGLVATLAADTVTVTLTLADDVGYDENILYSVYFVDSSHEQGGSILDPQGYNGGRWGWNDDYARSDLYHTLVALQCGDSGWGVKRASAYPYLDSVDMEVTGAKITFHVSIEYLMESGLEHGSGFGVFAYSSWIVSDTNGIWFQDMTWDAAGLGASSAPAEFNRDLFTPQDFEDLVYDDPIGDDYTFYLAGEVSEDTVIGAFTDLFSYSFYDVDGSNLTVIDAYGDMGTSPDLDIVGLKMTFDPDSETITVTLEIAGSFNLASDYIYQVYLVERGHQQEGFLLEPQAFQEGSIYWEHSDLGHSLAMFYLVNDPYDGPSIYSEPGLGSLTFDVTDKVITFSVSASDLQWAGARTGTGFGVYAYCHHVDGGYYWDRTVRWDAAGLGAAAAPAEFNLETDGDDDSGEEIMSPMFIVILVVLVLVVVGVVFALRARGGGGEAEDKGASEMAKAIAMQDQMAQQQPGVTEAPQAGAPGEVGEPQEGVYCPSCGAFPPPGSTQCPNCGNTL